MLPGEHGPRAIWLGTGGQKCYRFLPVCLTGSMPSFSSTPSCVLCPPQGFSLLLLLRIISCHILYFVS